MSELLNMYIKSVFIYELYLFKFYRFYDHFTKKESRVSYSFVNYT